MPSLNVCIYVLEHGGASHVSIKSNRARRNTSMDIEGICTFAPHLASFYSTALSRGEVPSAWRQANVIPVLKKCEIPLKQL